MFPPVIESGLFELLKLQIITKSVLGSVAYYTGGITLQNGWLRILGSGHPSLSRTINSWNNIANIKELLLVADDIIGGFFAINGGYLPYDLGRIFYLPHDTLEWESLEMTYSEFLHWAITGDLNLFYEPFRWNDWKSEILSLNGCEGLSFYPFLWTEEFRIIDNCSRMIISIEEIWKMKQDLQMKIKNNN